MVIKIRKKVCFSVICGVLLGAFGCAILPHFINLSVKPPGKIMAGGILRPPFHDLDGYVPAMAQDEISSEERFQRPSKAPPYPNPYTFEDFQQDGKKPSLAAKKFEHPQELILAYYGILREASNMLGYSGGCGTIGQSGLPYPYAYELLTKTKQKELPLDQYVDSFAGIGYTTLLKLLPAYTPPGTPENTQYYMVELEVITGAEADTGKEYQQGSQFAYYYGLVTVEKTPDQGWKIQDIYYIPEDFLCAPMHNWFYLSDAVVQIVYGNNLKLIDQIDQTEREGDMIRIYASGNGKSYRFDFVRITNGYDILLHEYILEHGVWKETSLLDSSWENMKLTVRKSQLQKAVSAAHPGQQDSSLTRNRGTGRGTAGHTS